MASGGGRRIEGTIPPPLSSRNGDCGLAERVAAALEREIVAANWPAGEQLGSQTALMERFGVSRAVLRQAVGILEHRGVATMRRGPAGGLLVSAPTLQAPTTAMVLYLEHAGTTLADIAEARMVLEPMMCEFAARNVDEDGGTMLRKILTFERDVLAGRALVQDTDFAHAAISDVCGNAALDLFHHVLMALQHRGMRFVEAPTATAPHPRATEASRMHTAIVNAVVGGDAAAAATLMRAHLDELASWLVTVAPTKPTPSMWGDPLLARAIGSEDRKRGDVLAGRILDDIVESGWPVDALLGSEGALLERYAVTRSVLREALGLLELHAAVATRRGPGGGIFLAAPDIEASVLTTELYLSHQQMSLVHLGPVMAALENLCIDDIVAKGRFEEVRDRMMDMPWEPEPHTPEHLDVLGPYVPICLGEVSGNPIVTLFLQMMAVMWARMSRRIWDPSHHPNLYDSMWVTYYRTLEPLAHGDAALAKRRVLNYYQAIPDIWV